MLVSISVRPSIVLKVFPFLLLIRSSFLPFDRFNSGNEGYFFPFRPLYSSPVNRINSWGRVGVCAEPINIFVILFFSLIEKLG